MADARDAYDATADADSAQSTLELYCGQVDEGERDTSPTLVIGLAAIAVSERLRELTVRLDYLAHHVLKEPRQL